MNKREKVIERNRWAAHYAALSGIAPVHVKPVPDVKVRAPRIEPTEHELQKALIQWWDKQCATYMLPKFALFAVPNGSVLAGDDIARARSMQRMKSEGFRNGAPDLILAVARRGFHGLVIEMKSRTGRASPEQKEFHAYLLKAGYSVEMPRSTELAIEAIKIYLS